MLRLLKDFPKLFKRTTVLYVQMKHELNTISAGAEAEHTEGAAKMDDAVLNIDSDKEVVNAVVEVTNMEEELGDNEESDEEEATDEAAAGMKEEEI